MTLSNQSREVINSPESPASDDVLVEALLGFANGERIVIRPEPKEAWAANEAPEDQEVQRRYFAKVLGYIANNREQFKQPTEGRMWFQAETLSEDGSCPEETETIYGYTEEQRYLSIGGRNFLGYAADLLGQLKPKPVLVSGPHGYSIQHFNDFPQLDALLAYAVLLLLDGTKPYGAALSQCRLAACGRFYLAQKKKGGGRPNRTYCCPEHLDEHHNSAERKAATSKRARERALQANRVRARKHK